MDVLNSQDSRLDRPIGFLSTSLFLLIPGKPIGTPHGESLFEAFEMNQVVYHLDDSVILFNSDAIDDVQSEVVGVLQVCWVSQFLPQILVHLFERGRSHSQSRDTHSFFAVTLILISSPLFDFQ